MADLNIGVVTFGIEANTKGLQRAFSSMEKLRAQVNRLAQAQTKGATLAKNALLKQEVATRQAARTFVELRNKMMTAGAPKEQIKKLREAFQRLTLEMTSGKITTEQFARSMQTFKDKISKVNNAFTKFQSGATGKATGKLAVMLRNLESSAVLAIGPLSGVGARIRSLGAIAGRSGLALVGLFAGVTALAVGFAKLAANALNAGRVMEASMARFNAASGSLEIARKEMGFVIQTSLKLGLRIDQSAKAFSRLAAASAGTALEGKGARDVFLAVSKAAAALRLSGAEVEGTFRAIEQMMSKGTVQAEELRGQLGERLPGAFRIAAEAMKVTTRELGNLLKAGDITAEEFLPELARALEETFGAAAEANIDSFQGSMNNLANQTFLFGLEFNRIAGITDLVVKGIKATANAIEFLRKNLVNIISLIGAVGAGLAFMARAQIAAGILFVAKAIRTAAISMLALNAAMAANIFGKAISLVIKFAGAIIAATAAFFGLKFALDEMIPPMDEMNTNLDDLEDGINAVGKLSTKFKNLATSIEGTVQEAELLSFVLDEVKRRGSKDIELITKNFEVWLAVEKLTKDELNSMFDLLMQLGSGPIVNDIFGIVDAIVVFAGRVILLNEELGNVAANEALLKSTAETIEDLGKRFIAIGKGTEALEIFDNVTQAITDLIREFEALGPLTEEQAKLAEQLRAALLLDRIATDDLTASEKKLAAARKKAETDSKKLVTGLVSASNKIKILQERVRALAEGPDSFEVFTKVTEKVLRFEDALRKAGATQQQINAFSAVWQELLEEQFRLTDRFARAGQQASAAIVNGLEDIILKGGSVTDMLHGLANELLRVALRALFLDKLQASLGAFFGGFGASVIPAGAGASPVLSPGKGFSGGGLTHGGSFTIGGSGGSDRPVTFFGKPGELVTVQRPDQQHHAGGGGSVIINQTNNFEGGGLADPAVLIPLIEENNRRLKGEILDGLDRGTFR